MKEPLTVEQKATNAETWDHINLVMKLLASAQIELMRRQFTHDRSKLTPPEVSTFTEMTPKLATSTYGSDEYKQFLADMKPALDHHYAHNRHHPEFFEKGQPCQKIDGHLTMAKWAEQHGKVLPDDCFGYAQLIEYLERKQVEQVSSVNRMNLFDLLEMLIDWYAATKRHNDGNIYKSIEINTGRFGLSPQLVKIFENTIPWIADEFDRFKTQRDIGYVLGLERTHIDGVSLDNIK